MRIPKSVINDAHESYDCYIANGYKPAQAWSWVMVNMKWQYHKAHKQAVDYGFIKT